jgi:hypothetical protein
MSFSQELNSSFIAFASVELKSTTTSQSRKWRALVWKHCRDPTKEKNQAYLYCTYYTDLTKSPYSTSVSENIKKHLKGYHKITVKKALLQGQSFKV